MQLQAGWIIAERIGPGQLSHYFLDGYQQTSLLHVLGQQFVRLRPSKEQAFKYVFSG